MKILAMSLCILGSTLGMVACGQKGALYLSDSSKQVSESDKNEHKQPKNHKNQNSSTYGIPKSEDF